ncbi:Fic family protein [Hymenobacter sp. DH14]|uniref:Fic family protein n=1 Tax=Hymenobacter cyanobacteriorum TaxID=2926463 RepID=A0A9X1VI40_9BACT|nr:Fic family protein [Hymenobacter cyanobacteriorum]MCI1189045.1 Fic family protein [Hymenobacter cyanobacteriorum]
MSLFTEIDRLKADLDTLRPLAPEQEQRVLQKFRLEWNYNSNAIEGNSLTLGETRSLLLHGLTAAGKPMRDHLDIKGHNEAVLALEEFVRSEYPLTEQFIREMHQLLLGEAYLTPAQTAGGQPTRKLIVPGRYKTSPNNVLTATGETFYFASVEETPGRMMDLVDWYRAEEAAPTMHAVALAAEFHYRFVRIHPFDDGNGRMSRLLMNLILLRHGYPMTVIKAADRNPYLAALSAADAGDPEPFLRFIIDNVEAGLRLMIRAAQGESIDEPADLDKKLALLKKQLTTREDFGKATWNPVTQKRLYESLINFWFENLGLEMARFNDLFIESKIFCEARDTNRKSFSGHSGPKLENALEFTTNVFTNGKRVVEEVKFFFQWDDFTSLVIPFSQGAELKLVFHQHSYQAEFSTYERKDGGYGHSPERVFESTYIAAYDFDRIKILNHEFANKVYDFIAAKVAEADSSPS